jgi:tRNA 2-selenouridine synthase SelU
MSKERLQKHKNRRAENEPILEAEKLIKERLIWQHLARKKMKRVLKKMLHISEGQ